MTVLNIASLLEYAAQQTPQVVYILDSQQKLTFSQVEAQARRFANLLEGLGIKPGERVALLLPNTALFPICQNGVLKLGAVAAPLNVTSPGPEIAYFLEDSQAVALVTVEPLLEAAVQGFQAAASCKHLIVAASENFALPDGAHNLMALMSSAGEQFATYPTHPDDAAIILYTAGTTGRSKGALLTHFNIQFIAQFLAHEFWQLGPQDVILMVAPAAHIFGQTMLNTATAAGAAVSLLPRFDPGAFLGAIQAHRATFFAGVPTLAHFMLSAPVVAQFDLSSLRKVMFGGALLSPEVAARFQQRFQVELITGYGLTEGVPVTFLNAAMYPAAPAGSVGRPAQGTQVRIVDEQDSDLPAGQIGEIIVRGPQMFREYYGKPELTAEAWRGGWFHSGDAGLVDERGYIFIVDRLKEIIKRSGYSIAPGEVEAALLAHPAVAEAAVVGVPDEALGEEIKAFVVLKPGQATSAEQLIEHCKGQVAAYKYPRRIEFRESLPKSPAGKVLRRALREAAA